MTDPAERDRAIERLLKSGRIEPPPTDGAACLDADILAAWSEGTLSRGERAAAEAHAADCAGCQALLAAMVRTEPTAIGAAPRWSPRVLIRWAVPLTAAAAAALWFAIDRDVVPPAENEGTVVQAPAAVPERETALPVEAPAERPAPKSTRPSVAQDAKARRSAPATERDEPKQRADRSDSFDRLALKDARGNVAAPPAAPAAAPAPQVAGAAPPPPQAAQEKNEVRVQASETPAPVPRLAKQSAGAAAKAASQPADAAVGGVQESVGVRRFETTFDWTQVVSPDPLVRWRFSMRGQVERSVDGGATWAREAVPVTGILSAGSAPSSSVCWIGGRGGLILRFTATEGWRRSTLPTVADVVTVVAETADRATVTLSDGTRLSTTDGGGSWRAP